jgi:hypothetical protein
VAGAHDLAGLIEQLHGLPSDAAFAAAPDTSWHAARL